MKKTIFLTLATFHLITLSEGAVVYRSVTSNQEILDNTGGLLLLNIDLNNDGVTDFFTSPAGGQVSIVPTGNNRILSVRATLPDLGRSIEALDAGYFIGGNPGSPLSWNGLDDVVNQSDNGGSLIYRCSGRVPIGQPPICSSEIERQVPAFVGLELDIEGSTHYGWVEISSLVSTLKDINVHGWAYETEPDIGIQAGAIPEPSTSFLLLFCIPALLRRRR